MTRVKVLWKQYWCVMCFFFFFFLEFSYQPINAINSSSSLHTFYYTLLVLVYLRDIAYLDVTNVFGLVVMTNGC